MISARLRALIRCPADRGPLAADASGALVCGVCGTRYAQSSPDWIDLRPETAFAEQTKYLDEALHQDARHESVSPPLLQSGVRQRQLRRFLRLGPGDLVIDLGCGSGRSMLWNAASGAAFIGVDVSPFFAQEARAQADLALGDLRRLPFADGTFTKAYALDVLEHLSPEALDAMLAEAARVLAPGGVLFVYSHVRKNAPIAKGLRAINALARGLERAGLIDMRQERLRKSDHLNPLADIPELRRVAADAGFRIARIRYYTPIVGGFVENVMMRLAEKRLAEGAKSAQGAQGARGAEGAGGAQATGAESAAGARRTERAPGAPLTDEEALKIARAEGKRRVAESGTTRFVLRALTLAMKLDLVLFGRIESGPFFALLERQSTPDRPPVDR